MTRIEWTDETWNPIVGCTNVSPGCDNCYAAGMASRALTPAHAGLAVKGEWTGEIRMFPDRLDKPLHWRKPRRVFVCSMSDLFHPEVPDAFIGAVWDTMAISTQHTYQVLTKRPQRMARALGPAGCGFYAYEGPVPCPQPNVWLGTSIESDRYTWRANHLRATPAAVRFLSLEPLLGPLPSLDLTGIGWVIVGGESGAGARPMHPQWVRDIRDRCVDAGVPFFFKQWGHWVEVDRSNWPIMGRWVALDGSGTYGEHGRHPDSVLMSQVGKKVAGRLLDGRTWDEYPSTVVVS